MEVIKIKFEKNEVVKKVPEVEICFKCSACSKFCPVTINSNKYNLEDAFISQLFSAEKPQALNDIWMCCACEKCIVICPQDSDPTDVFTNLKQLSYEEGLAPDIIYGLVNQVLNTGMAYDIGKAANAGRKRMGLKEIEANEQISKELKIIAEKTALKKSKEGA